MGQPASPSGTEAAALSFLIVPHRVQRAAELRALLLGLLSLGLVSTAYVLWLHLTNPTIVSLSFLLIVLAVATMSTRRVAIATSFAASFCFNFFFLAPVGTLRITDPQNLAELFTLLAVSLLASHLSSQVREAQVLSRAAELKSALLESLSHALKTPLTAVTVAANNLNAASLTVDERREQAGIVRAELDRLNRLFQDIVDMARIETRAVAAEKEWVQPAEIVEAAARQVESSCAAHRFEIDMRGDRSLVRVDPRLTSAALAHVLENAGQYSPAGSPIDIAVAVEANELRIAVRDRGMGIKAHEQDRLFERSYRGSEAQLQRFGTGLGLTIARGLVAAEGGRISAANHPQGGAIVTIAVPAETRAATVLEGEPL
ncbi:MAG TPA: ATP-binding protein [Vicinamibacterales bacterium]|jgi:two-component system, OmpR family, sensor histidine kinase KdpD|nr:ATP-binding protein [Vicinamibacterales bacterium]